MSTERAELTPEEREMLVRLKNAVRSESAPPDLQVKIRQSIEERATGYRFPWLRPWTAVAAALAVCFGGAIAYQLGHLRLTTSSQESYIASVTNKVATIMRVGLGDHIHCAVFRKYPKNPPKAEEAARDLGIEYQGLAKLVSEQVPKDYRLMMAHRCRYRDRSFVHLALKSDSRLLSVVVAQSRDGESFETEGLLPALIQSGVPIYQASAQRFEIAAFESQSHLIYLISDLPRQQNTEMMLALAPGVKNFLQKLEG
jgi:hypothetical protein